MSSVLLVFYRFSVRLREAGLAVPAKLVTYLIRLIFSAWLPASAVVGRDCTFGKGGLGIVVHELAVIGDQCIIGNNVTIGGASKKTAGLAPRIGNRVRIGSGAVIVGDVEIGDGVLIGANSVVVKSVPARTLVGGNPACVIRENIEISDYVNFRNSPSFD